MDAALAKEATAAQAEQGADVFVACGNAGSFGMIQGARELGLSAFGYVYDESALAPDNVVASMAWQIGETYRQMVEDIQAGNFQPTYDLLMSDGGFEVQVNPDYSAASVSAEAMDLFETRQQEVIDGTFQVPVHSCRRGADPWRAGPCASPHPPGAAAGSTSRRLNPTVNGPAGTRESRWAPRCETRSRASSLGAVDKARLAPAQEVEPDHVQAGKLGDDAAVMAHLALVVQHRHVEPGVVGPETLWPR